MVEEGISAVRLAALQPASEERGWNACIQTMWGVHQSPDRFKVKEDKKGKKLTFTEPFLMLAMYWVQSWVIACDQKAQVR